MSLINRMLHELQRRGSGVPSSGSPIRPVTPPRYARRTVIAGVVGLLAVVSGALWYMWPAAPVPNRPATAMQLPLKPGRAAPPQTGQSVVPQLPSHLVVAQSAVAASQPVAASHPGAPEGMIAAASAPQLPESDGLPLKLSDDLLPETASKAPGKAERAHPRKATRERGRTTHAKRAKVAATLQPVLPAPVSSELGPGKTMSPGQHAEQEYAAAVSLIQQGREDAARPHLEYALRLNPAYVPARLALATLMVGSGRGTDAENLLTDGLRGAPNEPRYSMLLARIQVQRGATSLALDTLRATLPYAQNWADYQAFVAALLQRQGQHAEAVQHYQAALRLAPETGVWWMGMGLSLEAMKRKDEARAAYQRALNTQSLSAELQKYVAAKLK